MLAQNKTCRQEPVNQADQNEAVTDFHQKPVMLKKKPLSLLEASKLTSDEYEKKTHHSALLVQPKRNPYAIPDVPPEPPKPDPPPQEVKPAEVPEDKTDKKDKKLKKKDKKSKTKSGVKELVRSSLQPPMGDANGKLDNKHSPKPSPKPSPKSFKKPGVNEANVPLASDADSPIEGNASPKPPGKRKAFKLFPGNKADKETSELLAEAEETDITPALAPGLQTELKSTPAEPADTVPNDLPH